MAPIPVKPLSQPLESVKERFCRLATLWHQETDFLSSMEEANKHPAYQEIIQLGPEVVPFLLRDLEDNHTHWFNALQAITGENPIPESASGNIPTPISAKPNSMTCSDISDVSSIDI